MSESPEIFELAIQVVPADIDQIGHVNNVTYLRWVQDVAVAHWTARATAEEQAQLLWVALRHEIDYKQAAFLKDAIVARTWVGQASRIKFERHTEILRAADRVALARARTLWCPIDASTLRPTPVSAALRARFSAEAETRA
jgi:acyl-CoA thioester hydrolase